MPNPIDSALRLKIVDNPPSASERAAVVLLALVALLQVAAFAFYVPGNDWARDLFMAARIADGGEFPLRGPIIGATGSPGPVWYWLLAFPVGLGFGFIGTALFVGVLATLKVPLAWRLGARVGGRSLALPFAALMLLPGWSLLTALQLTHTVLLETLVIAALLPLLTLWRGGGPRQWLLFGLLAGLAVHAHPVAGYLAMPAFAVAWRRRGSWRGDLPMLAAGVLVALLPLVPMLVAEMREEFPTLAAIAAAEPGERTASLPVGFLGLLRASTFGVLAPVFEFAPSSLHGPVAGGFVLLALAAIAGFPTLLRDRTRRNVWFVTLAFWLLAAAWLLAVRATVPFYMAALMWPLEMLLLALPLAAVAMLPRIGPALRVVGVACALLLAIVANIGVMATMQSGHAALRLAAIYDIRSDSTNRIELALMPIWAFDGVARQSCGARTLRVHGELGALVDFYQGVPFAWTCTNTTVELGGSQQGDGVRHWAGATPHTLHLLGAADTSWRAAMSLSPIRVIHPQAPLPLAQDAVYPHRPFATTAPTVQRIEFSAGADEAVAVYAPLFIFDGSSVLDATCNGAAVAPASITNSGALFLPPANATAPLVWSIETSSRAPAQVDVVTLPYRPTTELHPR